MDSISLRVPYSSFGDSKEPRPRSRSPVYGRDGREPRDSRDARDSREPRPVGHSRDPDYRYRSSESRDKDIRGDPRDSAYRWLTNHPLTRSLEFNGQAVVWTWNVPIKQRRLRPILSQRQCCWRLLQEEGWGLQGSLRRSLEWTAWARRYVCFSARVVGLFEYLENCLLVFKSSGSC